MERSGLTFYPIYFASPHCRVKHRCSKSYTTLGTRCYLQ